MTSDHVDSDELSPAAVRAGVTYEWLMRAATSALKLQLELDRILARAERERA